MHEADSIVTGSRDPGSSNGRLALMAGELLQERHLWVEEEQK